MSTARVVPIPGRACVRLACLVTGLASIASTAAAGDPPALPVGSAWRIDRSAVAEFDAFGTAIAATTDGVLVGCRGADGIAPNIGALHVFSIDGSGALVETQRLLPADPRLQREFGHAVSARGDAALVGAPLGGVGGVVGLLQRSGGVWGEAGVIQRGEAATGDEFGTAVAMGTNNRLAIGAPGAAVEGLSGAGLVEVRTLMGGTTTLNATLTAPMPVAGDRFGAAVALLGDWLAVGAPFDDTVGENAGAVHIFRRLPTGQWIFSETLLPPAGDQSAFFGRRVAIDGTALVVGAPRSNVAGMDRGAAFVYRRSASAWLPEATLLPPAGSPAFTDFGDAVAIAGSRIAVGAPSDPLGGSGAGGAVVFEASGGGWASPLRLQAISPNSFFATAVGIVDGMVVAGAPLDSAGGTYSGAMYVVDLLADCDDDGISDAIAIASALDSDSNGNGVPDGCEACLVVELVPAFAVVPATGSAGTFAVSTSGPQCSWSAVPTAGWIEVTAGGSGTGLGGTVAYLVQPNDAAVGRSGAIMVDDRTFVIEQAAASCAVTGFGGSGAALPASGGTGSVSIGTNGPSCAWSVQSTANWLQVTAGGNGTGESGTVDFVVSANPLAADRSASLIANGFEYTISQAAAACIVTSVAPSVASFPPAGGNGLLTVSVNGPSCPWSASTTDGWITVTGGTGTGSGDLSYSVAINGTGAPRTGTIAVGDAIHTVTQSAAACSIAGISSQGASFSATGGSGSFTIFTSGAACSWSATSTAGWIQIVEGASGTGLQGQLTYQVSPNLLAAERIGQISVGGVIHSVTQAAAACAVLEISPVAASFPGEGGQGLITLSTNGQQCGWSVASSAEWLEVGSGGDGSGLSGSVQYIVAPNPGALPRAATLSAGGQVHQVTQAGSVCAVQEFVPAERLFGHQGGSGTVTISTTGVDCAWAASSSASWVVVESGGSGSGTSGTIAYSVALNASVESRFATISAGDQSHLILQSGAPDCDGNGVPDFTEIASGTAADCNGNGVPDLCDIANGTSQDLDGNGVPDECESGIVVQVPQDFPSIQAAVAASQSGWVVRVSPGTYAERIDFLGKRITLESSGGPAVTTIDGSGLSGSVVQMVFPTEGQGEGIAVLRGFTITGGSVGTTIPGSPSAGGGGVAVINAPMALIEQCRLVGNQAQAGGGMAVAGGVVEVRSCRFEGNTSLGVGGGLWLRQTEAVVQDCELVENEAGTRGGGVYAQGGQAGILDVVIQGNMAISNGGGIGWLGGPSPLVVSGATVVGNLAGVGGGLWIAPGVSNLMLSDSEICGNQPQQVSGQLLDLGGNEICICRPDLNGDNIVDGSDLAAMLGSWGACGSGSCLADLDGDGVVDGSDLAALLGAWGACSN